MTRAHLPESLVSQESAAVVDIPVAEVTVMEDRARIVRRGRVSLVEGRQNLKVLAVSPVIVDKTLTVRGKDSEGQLTIIDSWVVRHRTTEPMADPDSTEGRATTGGMLRVVREEHSLLKKDIAIADATLKRLKTRNSGLLRLGQLTRKEITDDVSWGKKISGHWPNELAQLRNQYMKGLDEFVVLNDKISEKNEQLRRLDERISALKSPNEKEAAFLIVDLECNRAGTHDIQIEYIVPGVCWRPYHSARLSEDSSEVSFSTDGCVWQNCGEDWSNVRLLLSTQRVSLGTQAPSLHTDILALQRKSAAVHIEFREQNVQTVSKESVGGYCFQELPGIDDGGVALNIEAPNPVSISSNGRPHRIALYEFTSVADGGLTACPEISPCVYYSTRITNTGKQPILAGPIDLIRESGLVGKSKVLYVASSESFDIGWGPQSELRLRREVKQSGSPNRILSAWNVVEHSTHIALSNSSIEAVDVLVTERIPVSEIDKVEVEVDLKKTSFGQKPDSNGFVTWCLQVAPGGNEKVELHYKMKVHDDVQG